MPALFCSGCGYYPHFVDISAFCEYYLHFADIIRIGHSTSYLARNVSHVFHSLVLVVDIICIGHILHSVVLVMDIVCIGRITSYLACNVCPIFHIYSSSVSDWCITYFHVVVFFTSLRSGQYDQIMRWWVSNLSQGFL